MSNKLKLAGVLLCLLSTLTTSQGQTTSQILVYDYNTNSLDSLSNLNFDPKVKRGHTDHFCGEKKIAELDQVIPTSNLVDDTKFTNLVPLAKVQKELGFPYTAGVKIILPLKGDRHQATGVMVGERFVLTSAHSTLRKYTNEKLFEKLDVIAGYDHELSSGQELRSTVIKMYFVKDWGIGDGEDLVLLELEDPIGVKSGWMSIGFEQKSDRLRGDLYHKMSYPAYNTPYNDKPFTGDDLHVSFGIADYVSPEFLGVQNHIVGLGGESGSPIFVTNNKDKFITYGVLTYLGNYNHTRLRPSIYYAFESILNNTQKGKPVQNEVLKNFEVSNINSDRVLLSWDVEDKSMFVGYEVERSYDNENFEYLKSIDAADVNRNGFYGYIDKKPLSGMVYYKLTGIDDKEDVNYLDMKSLMVGKESIFDVNIYPNPTTDFINIDTQKDLDGGADLIIFNSGGKRMINQKLELNNTISTHDFEKGVYHVLLSHKEAKESFSFIVH